MELEAFVEKLVMHELENPRKVFCLQRKVWEAQVHRLQEQTDRLEQQVEHRCNLYKQSEEEALSKAADAELKAAAEQAKAADSECRAIEAECKASGQEQEIMRLRAEMVRLQEAAEATKSKLQNAEATEAKLQSSQLEEQRLTEEVAVNKDVMNAFRQREAELAGHMNPNQKIRYTMKLKEENVSLRLDVERLQKELRALVPPAVTSARRFS